MVIYTLLFLAFCICLLVTLVIQKDSVFVNLMRVVACTGCFLFLIMDVVTRWLQFMVISFLAGWCLWLWH